MGWEREGGLGITDYTKRVNSATLDGRKLCLNDDSINRAFYNAKRETTMAQSKAAAEGTGADTKATEGTRIKWDDANMKSSYANVCNVTSTREEVVMLFGVNQAWNRGQKEVTIQLTDRIIVSPYAAKRLMMLLDGVVKEYEKRFGALNVEGPTPQR